MGKAKLAGKLVNRFGMGHHCVDELAARCSWKMMELSFWHAWVCGAWQQRKKLVVGLEVYPSLALKVVRLVSAEIP